MRALAVPWPVEELERRYRRAGSALAAKRYQALWLRAKGHSVKAAAAAVGVTTGTPRAWLKRGVAEGLGALAGRKPGSGGRPKPTPERQEQVLGRVDAQPRVTMPALRRRIAAGWGASLSEPQVWKLVRRRGGRRADPAAQAAAERN